MNTLWGVFAVRHVCVFCSSLVYHFPVMLLRYTPSDLEMVPVVPIITGVSFAFTSHIR